MAFGRQRQRFERIRLSVRRPVERDLILTYAITRRRRRRRPPLLCLTRRLRDGVAVA